MRKAIARSLLAILALGGIAPLSGCIFGAIAANLERTGSSTIEAQYAGLADRSFAVVVASNRIIDAEFPALTDEIVSRMTAQLAEHAGASGVVPADEVRTYCLNHPTWPGMGLTDLAKALGGVERIVYIDIREFRLNEPGNRYEWKGLAAAHVRVVEVDSSLPDSFAFEKLVRVGFPGKDEVTVTADQVPGEAVARELLKRFVDRASWLFYKHEEPNVMSY